MWAKRSNGPQAKKAILYLYVEKDWVNNLHAANELRYLTTKGFQQVVWRNYQATQPPYNEPDEVKGIQQTPVVIGPIDALAPSMLGRLQESKEVAAGTFNSIRAKQIRILGSTYDIHKAIQ